MRALLILALALVAGCQSLRHTVPVAADAPAVCFRSSVVSADPPDTGVRWDCNAADPACWDDLAQRVVPALVAITMAEERSRAACAGFITDLKARKVIRSAP